MDKSKNYLKICLAIIGFAFIVILIIMYCKIQVYEKAENQRLQNFSDDIDRFTKKYNDDMERLQQKQALRQATFEVEERRRKAEHDLKMAELDFEEQKALGEILRRSEKTK